MIVGILGPGGCGGTFLDWTIQYLSGKDRAWQVMVDHLDRSRVVSERAFAVVSDPLRDRTAHAHPKTHPNEQSISAAIDRFLRRPEFAPHTFYYVDDMRDGRTHPNYWEVIQKWPQVKFITYKFARQDIDRLFCFQYEKQDTPELFYEWSVPGTDRVAGDLPVWDQREWLSIQYPTAVWDQVQCSDLRPVPNNYEIDFDATLTALDQTLDSLFQYLGLEIDQSRWQHWCDVYGTWRTRNNQQFFQNIDHILQCIIHGQDHDLAQYRMSLIKEVIIASHLLYKHNLALKAFGLETLGTNTLDWAKIIEPNIYHNLSI